MPSGKVIKRMISKGVNIIKYLYLCLTAVFIIMLPGCIPAETPEHSVTDEFEKAEGFDDLTPEIPDRAPVEIEGLVLVNDLDESIVIDLKYATADNFTGQVIYPIEVAAIKKETGERLVKAQEIFKQDGYRIKLWDAYRPLSAQHVLWEAYPDPRYVIKPQDPPPTSDFRPRHNNGMSVDITLVDKNGNELEMPTGFDDFSEKAAPDYSDLPDVVRQNRDYLIEVMERVGFRVASTEWWHFDDVTGTPGPYLDVPLEAFLSKND